MTTLTPTWRFLKFAAFRDFFQWDAKRHFAKAITYAVPAQKLGDHILEFSETVRPAKEPDKQFKILGVNNKVGLFDAYTEVGRKIRQPYQRVEDGCLAYNPYRVNVGSIGLKTAGQKHDLISSAYVIFKCRETLLPEFLYLLFRSDAFNKTIRDSTSGSVRQNLTLDLLAGMTIPLPTLAEQKQFVAAYDNAMTKAAAAEVRANEQQQGANLFLETALGLKKETAKSKLASGILHFVRFATLDRWGEFFTSSSADETGCKYPIVRLGDHVAGLQNGWSPKCLNRPANPGEWGVLKLGAVSFGKYDDTATKALPPHFQPKPEYEVKPGDVLISRGNALSLVGAAVHVTATRERLMLADLIFRIVWKKSSTVDPAFLAEVMRMPMLRRQIESVATGTSPSMKKVTKPAVLNLRFPLPPLAEQRRIVARLDALRQAARTAQADAEQIRATAKSTFEQALFLATKEM